MVYTVLNGRLGNNLFQIAAGASLAKRNNTDYVAVCQDGYYLSAPDNCFVSEYVKQFKDDIFKNIPIILSKPGDYYHYFEPSKDFKEIPYHANIRIRGWFQSEKYFDKELVRELFEIPESIEKYIVDKYGNIIKNGDINSINVRRGDYLSLPHLHPVTSLSFYKKAIDILGKNEKYLIISDDIDWCKKHFKGDNYYFVDDEKPIIDLYIQTFCKNNIIANSSFSWWAAWLNPNPEKKIICPYPWFGMSNTENKDLIPDSWIKLKNNMSFRNKILAYYLHYKDEMILFFKKNTPVGIKNFIKTLKK